MFEFAVPYYTASFVQFICMFVATLSGPICKVLIHPLPSSSSPFQSRDEGGYFTFREVDRRRVAFVLQKSLQVSERWKGGFKARLRLY